jgi:predicted transcriptional regulator
VSTKSQTIEIDEATATALRERADARGMTVPDLVAQYVSEDCVPVDVDQGQLNELDRRWSAIEEGQTTVSHDNVVRWLETWGRAAFKPWRDQ